MGWTTYRLNLVAIRTFFPFLETRFFVSHGFLDCFAAFFSRLHLRPRRFEIFPPRMEEDFWRICVKGSFPSAAEFSGDSIYHIFQLKNHGEFSHAEVRHDTSSTMTSVIFWAKFSMKRSSNTKKSHLLIGVFVLWFPWVFFRSRGVKTNHLLK